jgi:hypothetical protein
MVHPRWNISLPLWNEAGCVRFWLCPYCQAARDHQQCPLLHHTPRHFRGAEVCRGSDWHCEGPRHQPPPQVLPPVTICTQCFGSGFAWIRNKFNCWVRIRIFDIRIRIPVTQIYEFSRVFPRVAEPKLFFSAPAPAPAPEPAPTWAVRVPVFTAFKWKSRFSWFFGKNIDFWSYSIWIMIKYTTLVCPGAGAETSVRLRLQPKVSAPAGSGSATLVFPKIKAWSLSMYWYQKRMIKCQYI